MPADTSQELKLAFFMEQFTELDIKEAIRMVAQDWEDNEHGGRADEEQVQEYFDKLMAHKAGNTPADYPVFKDINKESYYLKPWRPA